MNESELESKRARMTAVVKVGMLGLAGLVVSPVIFLAVKGLVGIVLALVGGLAIVNVAPLAAYRFSSWRLREIKAEAARNPIETLQLDFGERKNALHSFKESITVFSASVSTFSDKVDGFKIRFPGDSTKFEDQLSKMKKLLEVRKRRYKEAEATLVQYDGEIDRAKAIWEMGQEAAKMNNAAGMRDEDFLAKIKVETALDSVTTSLNTAFAQLETAVMEEDGSIEAREAQRLIEAQVVDSMPAPRQKSKASSK